MPEWLSEEFVRRHGIPVALALAIIGVLWLLVLLFNVVEVSKGLWIALFLGGVPIGYMTPSEAVDHRGTNGSFVLVSCWMTAILLSRHIVGQIFYIEDWVYEMLTFNIVGGFALVAGILAGSWLRAHAGWQTWFRRVPSSSSRSARSSSSKLVSHSAWTSGKKASEVADSEDLN